MNISGRPLRFRSASLNRWVNTTLQRIDLIVVASRAEIGIFENLHGIQPCKIVFAHWAFDLPHSESQMFTGLPHQYFCMIGRNNRDFETFCAAVSQIPARGVVIAMAPPDFEVPGNVQWFENLSMSDCIDCVRNAAANVVLVQDGERGAGHITIVMAMHCSKVNIVTDVATVGDYLVDGIHGYFVPLGSREEVACALRQVLDFPAETEAMGREAAKYAARWLSHSRRTERLRAILSAWVRSEHIDFEDPTWAMEHASLKTDQTSPCPHFSKKH